MNSVVPIFGGYFLLNGIPKRSAFVPGPVWIMGSLFGRKYGADMQLETDVRFVDIVRDGDRLCDRVLDKS